MIRHQKAADRVIAKAVIREIPADEWNRLVEAAGGVVPAPAARS
jgi:hypothetical protein